MYIDTYMEMRIHWYTTDIDTHIWKYGTWQFIIPYCFFLCIPYQKIHGIGFGSVNFFSKGSKGSKVTIYSFSIMIVVLGVLSFGWIVRERYPP